MVVDDMIMNFKNKQIENIIILSHASNHCRMNEAHLSLPPCLSFGHKQKEKRKKDKAKTTPKHP
jgi:hypothetical protein